MLQGKTADIQLVDLQEHALVNVPEWARSRFPLLSLCPTALLSQWQALLLQGPLLVPGRRASRQTSALVSILITTNITEIGVRVPAT